MRVRNCWIIEWLLRSLTHMKPWVILVHEQDSLFQTDCLSDFQLDKWPLQDAFAATRWFNQAQRGEATACNAH